MTPTNKVAPSPASELDPTALPAIRNVMAEGHEGTAMDAPQPPAKHRHSGRNAFPELPEPEVAKAKTARRLPLKMPKKRPSPRAVMLSLFALAVILRPWLVLSVVFIAVFVTLGVFLALGYDGFWGRALALGRWYAARRPERAAALHAGLDAFAMKWDAVLDRFPEGMVDGLYLPDFGEMAAAETRHDEALDRRFDSLRNSEA
ncbi:hypothetical protein [Sulfitobacter dubius]|uniref:hypothetical protein n=1 Tax=Sulfitobacter dubius TaxID=218673 RepID=UPI0022AF3008|nr:hypothetical protein [Sulfitobacter dubius]MCZ4368120.1 hypothetical protein [Sulfitobacter dubius]